MLVRLPRALEAALDAELVEWGRRRGTARLFARDASLWTGGEEGRWLGWLDAPEASLARLDLWRDLASEAREFRHVVLLGMGGSSLAAEVFCSALGRAPGNPRMIVLDSTSPDRIREVEQRIDPARTLVVVASKSGSTLEPSLLAARLLETIGSIAGESVGRQFLAITDPGSRLETEARERGFRRVIHGEPTIGGRFSALSPFGVAPAALQGADVRALLDTALEAAIAARRTGPAENRAVRLGLLMGVAAREGVDKLTFVAAPELALLGAWLEQLVAESTGKRGRAVLPFDGERLAGAERYGADRLFVVLRYGGRLADHDEAVLAGLAASRAPIVEIDVERRAALGAQMFRWEVATAVAGAVLGIDPFDQPDVEVAKVEARRLTTAVEETGALPEEKPLATEGPLAFFADAALAGALQPGASGAAILAAHLARLAPGDYFALLAFLDPSAGHEELLQRTRHRVRDARRVATALGFGPRYLHSTGQAHKGGPPSGVFVVLTADPVEDVAVPGRALRFGQVLAAQGMGDFEVLRARGRRALRVHLAGGDPAAGLERLDTLVAEALRG